MRQKRLVRRDRWAVTTDVLQWERHRRRLRCVTSLIQATNHAF